MTNGIAGDNGLPLSYLTDGGQNVDPHGLRHRDRRRLGMVRPLACCDPTLAWDNFGNLFVGYLQRHPADHRALVTTDLGANFTNLGPVDTGAAGRASTSRRSSPLKARSG